MDIKVYHLVERNVDFFFVLVPDSIEMSQFAITKLDGLYLPSNLGRLVVDYSHNQVRQFTSAGYAPEAIPRFADLARSTG